MQSAGLNGQLTAANLCTLWDNHTQLRIDAAQSLAEFSQAFAAQFGADLCLSSGYRTLAQTAAGTHVRIRSTNRAALVAHARRVLLDEGA